MNANTLTPALLHKMDAYWRAANYLSVDGVIAQGPARYREELEKEAETYLAGKIAGLRADEFERATALVLQGDPASEIIDLARKTPNSPPMADRGSAVGSWGVSWRRLFTMHMIRCC